MTTCTLTMFQTSFDGLGISLTTAIMLIVALSGIIFYARDVRLGVIMHFFMYNLIFMWFYNANKYHGCTEYDFVQPLVASLVFFALMALLLYPTNTVSEQGGFV